MNKTAAQLVGRVLPQPGLRQYVLTFPRTIRPKVAFDPQFCKTVLEIWNRCLLGKIARWALLTCPF